MKTIALIFASILMISIFSFGVFSAGSSTGGENETESDDDNESASEYLSPTREGYIGVCETKDDRKERVKCRLEASKRKEKIEESIPEACRKLGATKKEDCRAFYKRIQICYDKVGEDKDRCFKEKSGLLKASLVSNAENKEGIRNYISTLLYDLQERVEKKVEAGEVTADEGAELISMITEIKEDITNQVPGKEVKDKMNKLKNKWREVMQ